MAIVLVGKRDPEMIRIESLLTESVLVSRGRIKVLSAAGFSVEALTRYVEDLRQRDEEVLAVECGYPGATVVDHHNEGDPGFSAPPSEFLPGSSLGQIIRWLAFRAGSGAGRKPGPLVVLPFFRLMEEHASPGEIFFDLSWRVSDTYGRVYEIPQDLVLAAASDHCPAAAYQGQCPGVDPSVLRAWRTAVRGRFKGKDAATMDALVDHAISRIRTAKTRMLGGVEVADLRGEQIPELQEASLITGVPVLYSLEQRDRTKIGILGAGEGSKAGTAPVEAFLREFALKEKYGSPVRGYAGGYV